MGHSSSRITAWQRVLVYEMLYYVFLVTPTHNLIFIYVWHFIPLRIPFPKCIFFILISIAILYSFPFLDYQQVDREAKWLKHWTQDPGVWGLFPTALVMYKSLGQALNPYCLWPPSSNGYLVHESKVGSTCAGSATGTVKRQMSMCTWISDYKPRNFTFN